MIRPITVGSMPVSTASMPQILVTKQLPGTDAGTLRWSVPSANPPIIWSPGQRIGGKPHTVRGPTHWADPTPPDSDPLATFPVGPSLDVTMMEASGAVVLGGASRDSGRHFTEINLLPLYLAGNRELIRQVVETDPDIDDTLSRDIVTLISRPEILAETFRTDKMGINRLIVQIAIDALTRSSLAGTTELAVALQSGPPRQPVLSDAIGTGAENLLSISKATEPAKPLLKDSIFAPDIPGAVRELRVACAPILATHPIISDLIEPIAAFGQRIDEYDDIGMLTQHFENMSSTVRGLLKIEHTDIMLLSIRYFEIARAAYNAIGVDYEDAISRIADGKTIGIDSPEVNRESMQAILIEAYLFAVNAIIEYGETRTRQGMPLDFLGSPPSGTSMDDLFHVLELIVDHTKLVDHLSHPSVDDLSSEDDPLAVVSARAIKSLAETFRQATEVAIQDTMDVNGRLFTMFDNGHIMTSAFSIYMSYRSGRHERTPWDAERLALSDALAGLEVGGQEQASLMITEIHNTTLQVLNGILDRIRLREVDRRLSGPGGLRLVGDEGDVDVTPEDLEAADIMAATLAPKIRKLERQTELRRKLETATSEDERRKIRIENIFAQTSATPDIEHVIRLPGDIEDFADELAAYRDELSSLTPADLTKEDFPIAEVMKMIGVYLYLFSVDMGLDL